jgi:hypothetical protein
MVGQAAGGLQTCAMRELLHALVQGEAPRVRLARGPGRVLGDGADQP